MNQLIEAPNVTPEYITMNLKRIYSIHNYEFNDQFFFRIEISEGDISPYLTKVLFWNWNSTSCQITTIIAYLGEHHKVILWRIFQEKIYDSSKIFHILSWKQFKHVFYLIIVIYYKVPPSLLLFKCAIAHNCVSVGSQVSVVLNFIAPNSALSHLAWHWQCIWSC